MLDIASRRSIEALVAAAGAIGPVIGLVHAAGVSPSMASPEIIPRVDLYGTTVLLETFGAVIAPGGAGGVIASQSGHRLGALTAKEDAALALPPSEAPLSLPLLAPDKITGSLHAYQLSKRANVLRVKGEAPRCGKRGARINAISPGIVITPLARNELSGPHAAYYNRMIESSPVGRAGTPDEVGAMEGMLMGSDGAFINRQ